MKFNNKKGFTLIELLAVIVILAIIMVIATMQVNKTIKKARQDSFELAYKNLKKEIKQRIVTGEEYLCNRHYIRLWCKCLSRYIRYIR